MKGNFYVMRCSAAVTCHVKVILNLKNWRLFIGSWSNKVWSNIDIFQLLKSLFLSFINSLRFNDYKELKYAISLWTSCVFFSLVLLLLCFLKLQNWSCAFEDKEKRQLTLKLYSVRLERLLRDLFCSHFIS